MARILFVDDDRDLRPLMKLMLTRLGHHAEVAARGEEAFELLQKDRFDLIILDLMMPDMDGFEVTRRLRADPQTQTLPILILSARTQPADREGAMQAGANGYISKPINPQDLSHQIVQLLNAASVAPPPETPPSTPIASQAPPSAAQQKGRVIVALGLRGGVGGSTLAVNLAGALALAGRKVCLVDLSTVGGHLTFHLRIRAKATWGDLKGTLDQGMIAQALTRHESGLNLLAAPPHPVRAGLGRETFNYILQVLRAAYAEVVVDAAPVLDAATRVALEASRHTLVVVTPEMTAVQTAVGALHALNELGTPEANVHVLLNPVNPEPVLNANAIFKALGRSPDIVLPFDRGQATALAQGVPLVFSQPNSPLVAAIASFAAKLT